jgi:hypothetical protein
MTMTSRKTAFRAGIESLERRETPSASVFAASATNVVPLNGSGSGQSSGLVTLPAPGYFLALTNITGSIQGVSTFTAQGGTSVTLHHNAIGDVNFTLADGDHLVVRLRGTVHTPTVLSPNPTSATFKFRILGGTGALNGASGNGQLDARFDPVTHAFTFTFRGKLVG